ncbi:MAG: UvrD-helicase domain-containing protein, partial [Trueperaceae bacterium]|nr:UvrD-helicase domain-containing protein [Trueperaceae bacterium]
MRQGHPRGPGRRVPAGLRVDDGALRAELQGRFTHFFVDEFQDTDPLQVELLLLLAADDAATGRTLDRLLAIFRVLADQMGVLETMTPTAFAAFR